MGISGLLPIFKSITKPVHLRDYSGKRAAVDIYSWLHKGAFGCSKDLVDGTPTDRYIDYCMHRVDLLRHHQIIPVLIFDGGLLPMKANQENKRQRSRKDYLTRAVEHERQGNQTAAYECYQKAVDITPAIALRLIQVLKEKGVEFIVAPYEADAQMAFLARNEYVHVVITEDSDMIAYRCPRVLYKMDKFGQGMEIEYKDIIKSKELNFSNFTDDMLLEMCVLSGCDYLSSLPGLGVKKAHNLVRRLKSYRKVIQNLCFNGVSVPKEYEDTFRKALLTFKHQRVYDPEKQQVVYLSDPEGMDLSQEHDFVGPDVAPDLARAIAEGDVNPITLEPFLEEEQTCSQPVKPVRVSPVARFPTSHTAAPKLKSRHMSSQKNKLATYFIPVSAGARKDFKPPKRTGEREELEKLFVPFLFPQDTPESQEATPPPTNPQNADSPSTPIASPSGKGTRGGGQGKRKQMKEDVQWIPGSPEVSSLSPCLSRLELCNGGSSPFLRECEGSESDCCSSEESGSLNGDWSFDKELDSDLVDVEHVKSGDSWMQESTNGGEFWDEDTPFFKQNSRNRKSRHQAAKGLDMDFCDKNSKRSKSMLSDETLADLSFPPKKKVSPVLDFDHFAFGAPSKTSEAEGSPFTDSDSGTPGLSDFEQRGVDSLFPPPPSPTFPPTSAIRHGPKDRSADQQQDPFRINQDSGSGYRSPYFGAEKPHNKKKSRCTAPLLRFGWSSDNPELNSSPDSPLSKQCWTPRDSGKDNASPGVDDVEADETPSTEECLNTQEDASGESLESSPERTRQEERRPYLDEISKQSFATNVAHLPHYSFTGHNVVHRVASSLHKSSKKNKWSSGM